MTPSLSVAARRAATLCFAAALTATQVPTAGAAELPNGVAAGDVTSGSAILWARAAVSGAVRFTITEPGDAAGRARRSRNASFAVTVTDPVIPAKIGLNGLRAGRDYVYSATDAAGNTSTGHFRTLPEACSLKPVRFGVSGDWRGELAPYPAVRNAAGADLDFFVKLGDTIYAEKYSLPGIPTAATLPEYRDRHNEVLSERFGLNTFKDLRGATAVFSMIDDHEVINDFSGGAAPSSDPRFDNTGNFINETNRYKAGLRAFTDYMPIAATTWPASVSARFAGKPLLYRARQIGRLAMVAMVDARSFRDAPLPEVTNVANPQDVGRFLAASFDPTRTLLGAEQFARLKADLKRAQDQRILWKFVLVPEPIQNLGVLAASDRFEGYAYERAQLLKFIKDNDIENVVFITADLHGTMVNNLTYQDGPGLPQIPTKAWEIVTGSVAFDAPFGPTIADLAAGLGLVSPQQKAFYDSLPVAGDADAIPNDKDDFIAALINQQVTALGYDPLGLAGSNVPATLQVGGYEAMHTFGWTKFEIVPATGALTVTTYGIAPYTYDDLQTDPAAIVARQPAIVSKFTVAASGAPGTCPRR
jgi:3-phytase/alkaline phosphatase D